MMAGTLNTASSFAELYLRLRQKEGRIYTDEEVAALPHIYASHPCYSEWVIRKHSLKTLVSYINHKNKFSEILEVGCGNGWLCAQMAKATGASITGLDINTFELEQARRVFKNTDNLRFIYGSLHGDDLKEKKFDMILFAASIQYFPSLTQIITIALEHLTLQGEIHIIDSPLYQPQQTATARQRTIEYYEEIGFAAMAGHYYHHDLTELENFQYKILHHPGSWKNKLSIRKNPFYRIAIKNRYQ